MSSYKPYLIEIELVNIVLNELNPRVISDVAINKLCEDLKSDPTFLIQRPPLINLTNGKYYCYAGTQRIKAAQKCGYKKLQCFVEPDVPKEVQDKRMILDNTHRGEWNYELLVENFDFTLDELKTLGVPDFEISLNDSASDSEKREKARNSLQEVFGVPPFSVLDTRRSYWTERKKHWEELGIKSQASREDIEIMAKSAQNPEVYNLRNRLRQKMGREPSWDEVITQAEQRGMKLFSGASIFDPVLTETIYNWFTNPGMNILDPFAGGSVRGIVAGMLERDYVGIDLRADQCEANQQQASKIQPSKVPDWITGDSLKLDEHLDKDQRFDFVFSCPPYHDLEKYSEDEEDLSNIGDYQVFLKTYQEIIKHSIARLKENRFACFVVSEIRKKKAGGFYKNFVADTVQAFEAAGAHYYNEIILINQIASLAIRAGRQFQSGRKIGRMHQNVLVFFKGDPRKIKKEFGEIKLDEMLEEPEMST